MFNGYIEKDDNDKDLTSKIEEDTKESNLCEINSNILSKVKDNDQLNLERFYEQKQTKIEELLNKKNQKKSRSNTLTYRRKRPVSINKREQIVFKEKEKSFYKGNLKKQDNHHKSLVINKEPQSISFQRDNLNILTFEDYISVKEQSI